MKRYMHNKEENSVIVGVENMNPIGWNSLMQMHGYF